MYSHGDYFNRYKSFHFNKKKSEDGKLHTDMIKNKDFNGVILDLIEMRKEDIPSECCGVALSRENICEFVYFLFYPHFELAKESILGNYVEPDECITLFLKGLKSESTNYFSNDKENEFIEIYNENKNNVRAFNKKLQKRLTNNEIFREFDEFYKYFIFKDCNCESVTHISNSYSGLLCNLMQIGNDTFAKKKEDKVNNCTKVRKNRTLENIKKSRLYNIDKYFEFLKGDDKGYANKFLKLFEENPSKCIKDVFNKSWKLLEYDDEKYTEYEFGTLRNWYALFNEDNNFYFKIDGENKFLELQLLDMRFGCSIGGYIFENFPKSHALNILDICGVFGILGLTKCSEKIIGKAGDFCELEKYYCRNDYRNYDDHDYEKKKNQMKDDIINLYKSVIMIFKKLTYEFVEYLHFLESYDKRKDYFKDSGIDKPCVLSNKWKYFLSAQCVEDCKKENRSKLEKSKAYFPNEIYYIYKNNFDEFYYEYLFKERSECNDYSGFFFGDNIADQDDQDD